MAASVLAPEIAFDLALGVALGFALISNHNSPTP